MLVVGNFGSKVCPETSANTLTLCPFYLLSTSKLSNTCLSTNFRPTSGRRSMTTMSTDTRARCSMRKAFWKNWTSHYERYQLPTDNSTLLITCLQTHSKLISTPPGNSQLQLPEASGVHAALRQRRSQLCDSNVNQAPLRGLPTSRLHHSRGNYRQEDVFHSAWRSQRPDQREYRHEALWRLLLWG